MRLNVGCGRNILEGWVNLDKDGPVAFDLEECGNKLMPFEDDSVDEFLLSHVLEHIHNSLPMMQELYRVAKPGAKMMIRGPYGSSDDAYEDPTHVRQIFLNSFAYFAQPTYWRADYGYRGDWQVENIELLVSRYFEGPDVMDKVMSLRNVVSEMNAGLIAIKPARKPKKDLRIGPQVRISYV